MSDVPWQLKLFKKTLKKQQRLSALKRYLADIAPGEKCLLVTCGDNNGAMNYFLRQLGGRWSFADLEDVCIDEMRVLLGQEVAFTPDQDLPYDDNYFDRAITIDVHEHLEDPRHFSDELARVVKRGGQVIVTVPNGQEDKLAVKLKHLVGMTPAEYGHSKVGLTIAEVEEILRGHRIDPVEHTTFSWFFTEILELTINYTYVKILSKKGKVATEPGQIAPATSNQVRSVGKAYRIYSLVYPLYWLISQLDRLVSFTEGYVVVVEGKKAA